VNSLEEVLAAPERDRVREAASRALGPFYSPWVHLAATSCLGLAGVTLGVWQLHQVRPWEWLAAVGLWVLSNAAEWRIHRDLLHHRRRWVPMLYDRHTPEHHRVFITQDMALRGAREIGLVMIPPYAIAVLFVGLFPLFGGLWWWGLHNLAGLFCIVTMGYILTYEWLHLAFHLPLGYLVGPLAPVRWLRRHHAIHHDPRLMQRWNFNVTVPLWDWVARTYLRSRGTA